jgi:non-ribosomal peptide synthetase component F
MKDEKRMSSYSYQLAVAADQNIKDGEYWLNKLSGNLIRSHFPYDYKKEAPKVTNPSQYAVHMQTEKFRFPGALTSKLMKLSKGEGIDIKLHIILVTGLFILLNKYTGHTDIMVGSPILKQEVQREFINTILVFRNEVKKNTSFKNLLLQVRETIIQANTHQNYPMEKILEQLNMPMVGNESPLFDVVILLENIYDKRFIQDIHCNMIFSFQRTDEAIEGVLHYNPLLYHENTIRKIIRHYTHILHQSLATLDCPLSEIQILSKEDKTQILGDFNKKTFLYSRDKTLVALFAEQVEKTPHHYACFAKGKGMTYKELHHQSNILAKIIREL